MSSLTGNLISSTYQSILKITTNNTASANLNNVTDGKGNATGLFVSTTGTAISGSFTVTGSMIVSGTLVATSSNATSASYALSSSYALTSSFAISSSYALTSSFAASSNLAVSASNANLLDGLDSTAFTLLSGSNIMTGSITLSGKLSFNTGNGNFVFPSHPAPTPVTGSAYYSGSSLYIYNGTSYLSIALA